MVARLAANPTKNPLTIRWLLTIGRRTKYLKFRTPNYFLLVLLVILNLAACAPPEAASEQAIVGQWTNPKGGVIHFYADKTGFIPGDTGQTPAIPAVRFTFYFQDATHLAIMMDGQSPLIVEIKLEGDTMTWFTPENGAQFVYNRAK